MFRWIMEKDSKRLMEQCLAQEDEESALKYLLTVAIGLRPYVEIGVQTNYGKELAQLLIEFIYGFFEQLMERTGRYAHLSYSERKFVLRYHSGAIIGICSPGRRKIPKIWTRSYITCICFCRERFVRLSKKQKPPQAFFHPAAGLS